MSVYEGSENYIFVSYAHKDKSVVVPIIRALSKGGYRVWYDQGIQAGTEWPEYIETHLENCDSVLIFMSPSAVDSINCRNEINLACMLKKKILVVYLEETVLAKGLNLQLNSQQSLFRQRHTSDETFLKELLKAPILASCKEGAIKDLSYLSNVSLPAPQKVTVREDVPMDPRHPNPTGAPFISRIGTMASNTPSVEWPKGTYSQSIAVNKFKAIHFHCSLIHPIVGTKKHSVSLRIFDTQGNIVYENTTDISFKNGSDRFSIPWVINDDAGLAQEVGQYTAIIWADDFHPFEYTVSLCRDITTAATTGVSSTTSAFSFSSAPSAASKERIKKLESKLKHPFVFAMFFIYLVLFTIAVELFATNAMLLGILVLLAFFAMGFYVITLTKRYVVNSVLLSIILVIFFALPYAVFLFLLALNTRLNRRKWKAELAMLNRGSSQGGSHNLVF